jgi:hypothetical protein
MHMPDMHGGWLGTDDRRKWQQGERQEHLSDEVGRGADNEGHHEDVLVLLVGAEEHCDAVLAVPGLPHLHVQPRGVRLCTIYAGHSLTRCRHCKEVDPNDQQATLVSVLHSKMPQPRIRKMSCSGKSAVTACCPVLGHCRQVVTVSCASRPSHH